MTDGLTETEKLQAEFRLLESDAEWLRMYTHALSGIVREVNCQFSIIHYQFAAPQHCHATPKINFCHLEMGGFFIKKQFFSLFL